MRRRLVLLVVAVAALALASAAPSAEGTFNGVVGPGFSIALTDAGGNRVGDVAPGTYTIAVDDRSNEHNFHLQGPGVDQTTSVDFVGKATWTVSLQDKARYTFICDPHATTMRGAFTVGGGPPATTPTPKPVVRLRASAPGAKVTLATASGTAVKRLSAGTYSIAVRDTSRAHNFHLQGPGVNRKTGIAFRGSATWRVILAPGTYRYWSDRAPKLRRSFTVT